MSQAKVVANPRYQVQKTKTCKLYERHVNSFSRILLFCNAMWMISLRSRIKYTQCHPLCSDVDFSVFYCILVVDDGSCYPSSRQRPGIGIDNIAHMLHIFKFHWTCVRYLTTWPSWHDPSRNTATQPQQTLTSTSLQNINGQYWGENWVNLRLFSCQSQNLLLSSKNLT